MTEAQRRWFLDNKERVARLKAIWKKTHPDMVAAQKKRSHAKHRDEINAKKRSDYIKNREAVRERNNAYAKSHKEQLYQAAKANRYARLESDPFFRLKGQLRSRVGVALRKRGWSKDCGTSRLLGADFDTVKKHIESGFLPGMSWENRREWHIDHKTPLCSAKEKADLIPLFHYTNLQPLWAIDNLKKGGRIPCA